MLVLSFPAGIFQTNCYVVAADKGSDAVVIDPGQESLHRIEQFLVEYELNPVAALLTHGHLDHTWDATALCDRYDIPAYIHPRDRPMLADPEVGIGPQLSALLGDLKFVEPNKVLDFCDREPLSIAGMTFEVDHAPGHSPGSVLLTVSADEVNGSATPIVVCFAGDVLFNGSIGRTDLSGGSHRQLLDSINERLWPMDDEVVVLPGHGPQTTIGAERTSNPFVR